MSTVYSHPVRLWSAVLAWAVPVACDHVPRVAYTFRSMSESYDVRVGAARCKKVEWVGGVYGEKPGVEPLTFGLAGGCYDHRASKALVRLGVASVSTACGGSGPPKKTDVSTGRGAAVPKGTVTRFGRGLSFFFAPGGAPPAPFQCWCPIRTKRETRLFAPVSTFFRYTFVRVRRACGSFYR